jgi:hypothetical protein
MPGSRHDARNVLVGPLLLTYGEVQRHGSAEGVS